MLNIRSIFKKCITAIQTNTLLSDKFSESHLLEMRKQLAIEMDYMISDIFVNLADSYPQAPAAGGTVRMRDAILDIKRV